MKTTEKNAVINCDQSNPERKAHSGIGLATLFVILGLALSTSVVLAHCDTMDGPVVADAKTAIEQNNVNYVLKWIQPGDEVELKGAFVLMMKVRELGPDAKMLSEKYFFETLVRLHRSGEGVPYTGLKPAGTAIDEKILAADRAIASGNLSTLNGLVPPEKMSELATRFDKVMSLKNFNVNDVEAGREFVESYVLFFKFAEGEEEIHNHKHME